MSDLVSGPRRRRRRSDAERSATAVLDAATAILSARPDAGVEEIAVAAGVSRQTVYAHFPSRDDLVAAVVDRITADVAAAIRAARLDEGPATEALIRFLDTAWQVLERYPLLQQLPPNDPADELDRHLPILAPLIELVERGQTAGDFDATQPVQWLLAATVALGHAAGGEVTAGRMTPDAAIATLRRSVLRVFGAQ
jgi:AcrR family transcriptional regulator